MPTENELLTILAIGHDTSGRGEGLSLRDARARARYRELRSEFGPEDLLPLIRERPELIEQWIMYSEDKRTDGGFWVLESGVVGSFSSPSQKFPSLPEAIAEYVVRELDFWVTVGDKE